MKYKYELDEIGSFGNVSKFDKEKVVEFLANVGYIMGHTLGPNGTRGMIQTYNMGDIENGFSEGTAGDNIYVTKDGHDIARAMRFNKKYLQAILNASITACKVNDDVSGDGTTTGYVFFSNLLKHLYEIVYLPYVGNKTITEGQFINLLRKASGIMQTEIVRRHGRLVTDYDKLIEIAKIALDNDEDLLSPLKNLLLALKERQFTPSAVNIAIDRSLDGKCGGAIGDGFEILSNAHMKAPGDARIEGVRLIVLSKPFDNNDILSGLKHLIKITKVHYEQTGEKTLVLCPTINHTYLGYLEIEYTRLLNSEGYSDRHMMLASIANTNGVPQDLYTEDLMTYFDALFTDVTAFGIENYKDNLIEGMLEELKNVIDVKRANGIFSDDDQATLKAEYDARIKEIGLMDIPNFIYNFVLGHMKVLPYVDIDVSKDYMTVLNNKNDYTDRYTNLKNTLIKDFNNVTDVSQKTLLNKRIKNLVGKYAVLYVGAQTDADRDTKYSQYNDAILAVNAAAKKGVVSGMCIPTAETAEFLYESLHLDNTNKDKLVEMYGIRTEEKLILVLEEIFRATLLASREIASFILTNADHSQEEADNIINGCLIDPSLWTDGKHPLAAYDVIEGKQCEYVISPVDSEVAYIMSAFSTSIQYLGAKLFFHKDEWSVSDKF